MKINITYDVITSFVLTIERDELPEDHDELLESVTRDELVNAPIDVHEIGWDNIKGAWHSASSENTFVSDAEDPDIQYYAT